VRTWGWICITFALAVSLEARAQCDQVYGSDAFGNDMTRLSAAMRKRDLATLSGAGGRLEAGLPCTGTVVPMPALASAYRLLGVRAAVEGREEDARRWFRSGLELDPSFEWGVNDLPMGDPIRRLFDGERDPALSDPETVTGKEFRIADGEGVLLDGRQVEAPIATLERPHLVQVVSGQAVSATYLIEGNDFPATLLIDAAEATASQESGGGAERVQRLRPPAKTPLLVLGGASLLASGGLYAASFATRSSFRTATTTDELVKHQAATNTLVIASGVALVLGMGSGYAGFMLNGGPGLFYSVRY